MSNLVFPSCHRQHVQMVPLRPPHARAPAGLIQEAFNRRDPNVGFRSPDRLIVGQITLPDRPMLILVCRLVSGCPWTISPL
jgi:hypothetical protein